jgi:hypothetical protein
MRIVRFGLPAVLLLTIDCAAPRPAVVVAIRVYEADTGRFLHEEEP